MRAPAKRAASHTPCRDKLEREHASHGTIVQGCKGERLLIPRPLDVDACIRGVRKGRVLRMGELRARLAAAAGAEAACPLCTGIFARLAAEAAEEDRRGGKKRVTPYWRLVRDDGSMQPKFPGGEAGQAKMLKADGVEVIRTGRGKLRVSEAGRKP